jgi:uncharacterized protein (DUF433 family)
MAMPFEPWQLAQLQRLASIDRPRCVAAIQSLFEADPALYEALVILATDQRTLTLEEAAERLCATVADVEVRLQAFRSQELAEEGLVTLDGPTKTARLANGAIAVWEIVREYRRVGSVELLETSFPGLSRAEVSAALRYARAQPEEINMQIARYEEAMERRRVVYPNA